MRNLVAEYNQLLREHGDIIFRYISLMIDMAESAGIRPAGTAAEIGTVANVIGSEGDHNTRCLAALIIGALDAEREKAV